MTEKNRRKYNRVAAFMAVTVHTQSGTPTKGEVEDISLGGVYLRCPLPLVMGQKVKLELHFSRIWSVHGFSVLVEEIDNTGLVKAIEEAQVKWVRGGHSFGLQFTSLSSSTKRFLKRLIKYFEDIKIEHASGE